jgi:hypothetical protein
MDIEREIIEKNHIFIFNGTIFGPAVAWAWCNTVAIAITCTIEKL